MIKIKRGVLPLSLIVLSLIVVLFAAYSISLGAADISSRDILEVISEKLFGVNSSLEESKKFIILNLRMPRIVLAIIVGGSLALSGCVLQAIFKNPMADPYVTGTSAGALFGGSIALLLFKDNNLSLAIASFFGSLLSTFLIYNFSNKRGHLSITTMLLAGLVLSSLLGAIVQIIMIFSKTELINIFTFTMGSFSGATWDGVLITFLVFIVSLCVYLFNYKELNLISIGDENASSIGLNVNRTKKIFLIVSALLTSVTVSFSGVIGFVGLIVPHFFRLIVGNNYKKLLPISILGGSFLMLLCDNIARTAVPSSEFPVGIVTSILGAPLFLLLLRKSKRMI